MMSFKQFLEEGSISPVHHKLPHRLKPFFILRRPQKGDYSREDTDLITQYVRNSHAMNELLRGKFNPDRGEVSSKEIKHLEQLVAGMDDLFNRKARTIYKPMTVFRRISTRGTLPDISSGPTKQFLSTTLDRNIANTYATFGRGNKPEESKLLKIHVEPNTPHLVNPTNKFEWENEIMFDRFRNLNINPTPEKTLTVIGQNYTKPVHLHKARLK